MRLFTLFQIRTVFECCAVFIMLVIIQCVHANNTLDDGGAEFVNNYFQNVNDDVDLYNEFFKQKYFLKAGLANFGNSLFVRKSNDGKYFILYNNVNYEISHEYDLFYHCTKSSGQYIYVLTKSQDFNSELCKDGTFVFKRNAMVYFWRLKDGVKGRYEYPM